MIRTGIVVVSSALITALFAPPPNYGTGLPKRFFQGGDLARRVTGASDGLVKMTYASRDGVCGDGRSFIAEGTGGAGRGYDIWFTDGMSMTGTMGDIATRCVRGPVRLL